MTIELDRPAGVRPRDISVLVWLRLVRVFQQVDQLTSRGLRCSELSVANFDVLVNLASKEGITQQQLADSLLVTKGNVCQILGRMEESGLIRRSQEGRVNRLYLTEKGRDVYERVTPAHTQKIAHCFSALSDEELSRLLGLLRKVDHSLDASPRGI